MPPRKKQAAKTLTAETVGKVLMHPVRVKVMATLRGASKPMSPRQFAVVTAATLGTTAYHVRELSKLGLLKSSGTRPARGAVEHFYTLSPTGEQAADKVAEIVASL